jgi:hypothetical protein
VKVTSLERPRRFAPLALLLVQLLLGVLAPIADARGEQNASDAVVHVESEDRPTCLTGHNHLQCQFCRHIGSNLLATSSVQRVPLRSVARVSAPRPADAAPRAARSVSPVGSRAPPTV